LRAPVFRITTETERSQCQSPKVNELKHRRKPQLAHRRD
jgi:hypothetical protein